MTKIISVRIKEAREKAGLKQGKLAEKLGIFPTTLSNYERGSRIPNADVLGQIAKFTKADPGWLLTGEEPEKMKDVLYTGEELEYILKLLTILREKDEGTRVAIMHNLDAFVRMPDKNDTTYPEGDQKRKTPECSEPGTIAAEQESKYSTKKDNDQSGPLDGPNVRPKTKAANGK